MQSIVRKYNVLHPRIFSIVQNDAPGLLSTLCRNLHTTQSRDAKKKKRNAKEKSCEPTSVAIILCGSGCLDGSDIPETMSAVFHASQKDLVPRFYAPDTEICGVVDHLTKEMDEGCPSRNALTESARIARSCIKPLCECEACEHGGLIIPGGFGLVRTLSDFSSKGAKCKILPDFERLIEDFYCEKKPIGAICIAAALIAKIFNGCKVTLGKNCPKEDWPYAEVIDVVKDMGGKVEMKDVKGVTRCKKHNVYTTPAFLYSRATHAEVHEGIGKMIGMMKKHMN